jgi:uncharacterized membrane protein
VTDAPVAAGQGKRRALLVLLALSLTLNLFFVAGAAWITSNRPMRFANPVARMRYLAAELHLDAQHQKAFERYLRMLRARLQLMHAEVRPLINNAWAELAKPQATDAEVMRLFDEAAKKHRQFQQELTTSTLAFLATLTPEQRQTFIELARRGPRSWSRSIFHRAVPLRTSKPNGTSR